MLSCLCYEDGDWFYDPPEDFSVFPHRRRKRCTSCKTLISQGETCLSFKRARSIRSDIEEDIYGTEKPLATWYLCEKCGEIWLNLDAIGYCVNPDEDMGELMREYHEMTGFNPKN